MENLIIFSAVAFVLVAALLVYFFVIRKKKSEPYAPNKPYIKEYDEEGNLTNPIIGSYLHKSPNRSFIRNYMKKYKVRKRVKIMNGNIDSFERQRERPFIKPNKSLKPIKL